MVSSKLDLIVERAYQAMLMHPDRALLPIWRHEIYHLLNASENVSGKSVYKRLSVITARYVLPVWNSVRLSDSLPERLINLAEGIMENTVSIDLAQDEANIAWQYLEKLGSTRSDIAFGNVFYVGLAALVALQDALGQDPFKEIVVDEDTTDLDLDPWCSDTAHWAAIVCSGYTSDRASDVRKRQVFWGWWLKEAIPNALKFSN